MANVVPGYGAPYGYPGAHTGYPGMPYYPQQYPGYYAGASNGQMQSRHHRHPLTRSRAHDHAVPIAVLRQTGFMS